MPSIKQQINFTRSNKFSIHIPELPVLEAMTQTVDLETITLTEVEGYSRMHDFKLHGEKLDYSGLDISFMIDKNYDVYTELYNFMNRSVGANSITETRIENKTDIIIDVLDNDSGASVRKFQFVDCWINLLGNLSWDFSDSAEPQISNAMFSYQYFKIIPFESDITGFTDKQYETENYNEDVFVTPV